MVMAIKQIFISPKNTSPHKHKAPRPPKPLHIQKVSGLIPLGSPLVLLCLLVVGCCLAVADAAVAAFGGASGHAAGNGVAASQAQERPAIAGGC